MTGLIFTFLFRLKGVNCYSTGTFVYPVIKASRIDSTGGYNVGSVVLSIACIYLFLTILSVARCIFVRFVAVRSGWRLRVSLVLNSVQMLTNLMFFAILVTRFMFGVRVCFCDFE